MSRIRDQSIANAVSIRLSDVAFAIWRRWSGKHDRSNFYVATRTLLMRVGLAHPTLGRKVPLRKWFNPLSLLGSPLNHHEHDGRGLKEFKFFTSLGIRNNHCVMDFGCGSLRMAQSFIPFLNAGAYWGFDISEQFINDGLANLKKLGIGSELGNYRVISSMSLAEGRDQKADFVISSKVAMHISPENLAQFVLQVSTLIHEKTLLIVEFDESEADMRTSGSAWAYSDNRFSAAFRTYLPDHLISINRFKKKRTFSGKPIYRSYFIASPVQAGKILTTKDLVPQIPTSSGQAFASHGGASFSFEAAGFANNVQADGVGNAKEVSSHAAALDSCVAPINVS